MTLPGHALRLARELPARVANRLRSRVPRQLFFTSDDANWAIDCHADYVAEYLRHRHALPVHRLRRPQGLRGQLIHAFDRYSFLRDEQAHRLHSSNALFLTWMHVDPEMPEAERAFVRRELPKACERLRALVVTCREGHRALLELGAPEQRLVTIPLGTDTTHFTPPTAEQRLAARAALGIPQGAHVIGSFVKDGQGWGGGELPKRIKGPDVFLAVLERLLPQFPNLFVVLSGPARGFMKAGLTRLGIPFVHRFLEQYRQIVSLYHALDLYLIPSRSEGGPLCFGEAWAAGVPVVSTRTGLPADYLAPGENGFLAEVDDVAALATHAAALLGDPALRVKFAERGRRDVAQLSWEGVAERHFQELYRPLLSAS